MPDLARFDARTATADDIGRSLDVARYVVVENMMTSDDLAQLRGELEPHVAATKTGETDFLGGRTKRFNNLFMRATTTRRMVLHPILLGAADHLLLTQCTLLCDVYRRHASNPRRRSTATPSSILSAIPAR